MLYSVDGDGSWAEGMKGGEVEIEKKSKKE